MHLLLVGFPEDLHLSTEADVSLMAFPFYNNLPWPHSRKDSSSLEVLFEALGTKSVPLFLAEKDPPSRAIADLHIPVKLTNGIHSEQGREKKKKNNTNYTTKSEPSHNRVESACAGPQGSFYLHSTTGRELLAYEQWYKKGNDSNYYQNQQKTQEIKKFFS